MNTRVLLSLLTAAVMFPSSGAGAEETKIGFVEQFALAADREQVLGQLIPGSEEYYFYHALYFQSTRQAGKLKSTMEQWAKRFPKSQQRRVIENREALLKYDADPQATLAYLREQLQLQFNHQQEARDQKPDLPSTLDQRRITREAFQREVLRTLDDMSSFNHAGLETLVREKVALKPAQIRALLAQLQRPDVPGLVELIEGELKRPESKGFGEFPIHRALLPEQLDDLARRRPALREHQAFVYARLRQLSPGVYYYSELFPG
ncbi:MAG: hypothetical protein M3463_09055, partial [Verrucomicrobiota bacterium]|nr:hypothetical protein [Verrucomicrobiota bacterium]